MKTNDFDYNLPPELIAQTPLEPRHQSGLMVLDRSKNSLHHRRFFEVVDYLRAGDVMVFNNSRVLPARLRGKKAGSGEPVEILLLRRLTPNVWETLVRCDKRVDIGARIEVASHSADDGRQDTTILAEVTELKQQGGQRIIKFPDNATLPGETPLPPYIHVPLKDPERYQTVYASPPGSVAAPTAGLHFTAELLDRIKEKGVQCLFVTLHIGLDTFRPVRVADVDKHPIHQEYGILDRETAVQLSQAKAEGRRIICVGTSTTRLLETVARINGPSGVEPFENWVGLFILPGHRFQMVDGLITNFHLPRSTLLMLVTAFAGKDLINLAYHEAIAQKYRFYSFGDAMLIF